MRIAEIIRAPKRNTELHPWNTGKVPRSSFPLKSVSRLQAGNEWAWRLVEFDALDRHFRVLIRLNVGKEYYQAILGMDDPRGMLVICHHELHTSHRDWHCHVSPCEVSNIFPGVLRDNASMRVWPRSENSECSTRFEIRQADAVTLAAERFGFTAQGGFI
ncbi:hypothetical protein [Acidocella sp.]|uniref:hypothetical protein n=1 Tax=Acidocella sp. TaxID=50710 RepID=UPI003CFBCC33